MTTFRNWGLFAYFFAVLLAVGMLFALAVVPGNSAELFPNPSPDELTQAVQWIWCGPSNDPVLSGALDSVYVALRVRGAARARALPQFRATARVSSGFSVTPAPCARSASIGPR